MIHNHFAAPKSPKTSILGPEYPFQAKYAKILIAISSDLCTRFTWNLTGSCGQQRRLRGWSRMVVKQFQDGGRPPFWKSIYRHNYLSEKSSDLHEILYTAADFELDERHVIKNEKVALDRLRVRQNVFLVSRWDRRTLRGNSYYRLNHAILWNFTTFFLISP